MIRDHRILVLTEVRRYQDLIEVHRNSQDDDGPDQDRRYSGISRSPHRHGPHRLTVYTSSDDVEDRGHAGQSKECKEWPSSGRTRLRLRPTDTLRLGI